MKKTLIFIVEFILTIVVYYSITFLFGMVFGHVYTPQGSGVNITPNNITFSFLFSLSLIAFSFLSGYKSRFGIFTGIVIAAVIPHLTFFLIYKIDYWIVYYFAYMIFIVPFSPVAELISRWLIGTFEVYARTEYMVIDLTYVFATIAFIIGIIKNSPQQESSPLHMLTGKKCESILNTKKVLFVIYFIFVYILPFVFPNSSKMQ